MASYANIEDLERRWRPLAEIEKERAQVLIDDASAIVSSELERHGVDTDTQVCKMVVCRMVQRVLSADIDSAPLQQQTQTAGVYSMTNVFNQGGSMLYISKQERRMLGISRGGLKFVEIGDASV